MPQQRFETCDTATAAFLECMGYPVLDYRWEGKSCFMSFDQVDGMEGQLEDFSRGAALVEPKVFNRKMLSLKTEILSRRASVGSR